MTPRDEIEAFAKWIAEYYGGGTVLWEGDPVLVPLDGDDKSSIDVGPEWEGWLARSALSRPAPATEAKCPVCVRTAKDVPFDEPGPDLFARGYEILPVVAWDTNGNPIVTTPRGHVGSLKAGEWEPAPTGSGTDTQRDAGFAGLPEKHQPSSPPGATP